ncbi:unnamed protein product [Urochloa humidicola]
MARLLVLRAAPYRHSSHLCAATLLVLPPSQHRRFASFPSSPPSAARRILPSPLRVPIRAVESSPGPTKEEKEASPAAGDAQEQPPAAASAFEVEELGWGTQLAVKLRMLVAPPWQRVRKGSVLNMKLRGEISDQLKTRFSSGLSLPQICENFVKAAYDPRISGIYLHIEPLRCGWGKVDEIRRHIVDFKKSGKFVVGYMPVCGEKEYYLASACGELYAPPSAYVALFGLTVQQTFLRGVLEKVGVEPEIQRIGKYKSAGDQLARKSMSNEVREMLATLLDNIYGNWLDTISSTHGKKREEIEEFINSGVYQVSRLKEQGWITDLLYDDEVMTMLKERVGQKDKKSLRMVDYRPDEAELFEKSAQNAYALFRDKAAMSRSMSVDQMETVAQGRVWSGQDAFSKGLVDSVGGLSQALAIAKQKANIPKDKKVQLVEVSKPSPTLPEILSGIGGSLVGVDRAVKGVLQDMSSLSGVQARMDGILFENLGDMSGENQLFLLLKDIVNYFD